MANIHFIGGEKGGVGKSLTSRVLAQYMIDREIPFLGFDTDRSHPALMRFYAGYASPVVMDGQEALDVVVEAAAEVPDRRILVDLAAQTHAPLVQWMDDAGVVDMAGELGLRIFYWHVMDSGRDSVDLLEKLLDRFGASVQYVLVRNQVRGNDFSALEASGQQQRAVDMGAKVVSLKKLNEGVISKIDAGSSSFWKAKTPQEPNSGGLGLMDRQRVKMWLKDVYSELDSVGI
jgi:hypothetical protein